MEMLNIPEVIVIGTAEIMIVKSVRALKKYNHWYVYHTSDNEFSLVRIKFKFHTVHLLLHRNKYPQPDPQ